MFYYFCQFLFTFPYLVIFLFIFVSQTLYFKNSLESLETGLYLLLPGAYRDLHSRITLIQFQCQRFPGSHKDLSITQQTHLRTGLHLFHLYTLPQPGSQSTLPTQSIRSLPRTPPLVDSLFPEAPQNPQGCQKHSSTFNLLLSGIHPKNRFISLNFHLLLNLGLIIPHELGISSVPSVQVFNILSSPSCPQFCRSQSRTLHPLTSTNILPLWPLIYIILYTCSLLHSHQNVRIGSDSRSTIPCPE